MELNRFEKSGKDAAEWQPPRNQCWFAQRVVDVRLAYGLTIDQAEADALDRILADCTRRRSRARSDRLSQNPNPSKSPTIRPFRASATVRRCAQRAGPEA